MTENNDKPTPAYVLNHARLFSKQEILDALRDSDKSSREYWRNKCQKPESASGGLHKDLVAIRAAIGKE